MKCRCDNESGCIWREPKRVLSCIQATTPEATTPVPTTVPLETTSPAQCVVPDWQGSKTEGLMVNGDTVYTKIRIKKQSFKKFSGRFEKNSRSFFAVILDAHFRSLAIQLFQIYKAILVFQRCFPNVKVHSSLGISTRPIVVDCGKIKKQRTIVSLTGGSYFNSVSLVASLVEVALKSLSVF